MGSLAGAEPSSVSAAETIVTFAAVADAQVAEASPTTNYATAALRTDGGSDPDVDSYLRFSVTGVSGYIVAATFRIYASSGSVDGPAIFATASTWSESTITWANRPARSGPALDDRAAIAVGAWVDYNVTSLVIGDGTVDLVLGQTSNDGVDFHSREGVQKPQLVVRTSPTPPDTVAPLAPTDLAADASSGSEVSLTWTAATDDTAVTAYDIERDGLRSPRSGR